MRGRVRRDAVGSLDTNVLLVGTAFYSRLPARSEPANSQLLRPMAIGRIWFSTQLLSAGSSPSCIPVLGGRVGDQGAHHLAQLLRVKVVDLCFVDHEA